VSGIESNCKAFQKTLNSFGGMVTDENTKELDDVGIEDNTNIGDEDFSLDNNIDQLFESAVNVQVYNLGKYYYRDVDCRWSQYLVVYIIKT